MSKTEEGLENLWRNPKADWRIEDYLRLAERVGLTVRNRGGSHYTFASPHSEIICTVARARPIRPSYAKPFVRLARQHMAGEAKGDDNG